MADPFDDILNIESQFIEQGQAEGRTDGRRSGLEEGRLVGLGRGFDIAKEIGFYYGCTVVWLGLPSNLEDAPERTVKLLRKLRAELEQFNFDATDVGIESKISAIRTKFRAVAPHFAKDLIAAQQTSNLSF